MSWWSERRRRIGAWARARAGLGRDDVARHEIEVLRAELAAAREELAAGLAAANAARGRFERALAIEIGRRRRRLDRIGELREQLTTVRRTQEYSAAYEEPEPLITVRIASHQRTRQLIDVALDSVFAQTYPNFEVVIVNDGPNERTRSALAKITDLRVRYSELPERGTYPEDPNARWLVAGTPAGNRGLELARGRWIAPLDEDDVFTPDHLERLLALAREHRAELAYGAVVQRNMVTGTETLIWSDPPKLGSFSLHGALYHQALTLFRYEPLAWTLHEPGDWNLTRRMLQAGVRVASTPQVVGTLHWVPVGQKATHPWAAPS